MTSTSCIKCNYESEQNRKKFGHILCSICFRFAPNNKEKIKEYILEKVDKESLNSFRKFSEIGNPQKKAMTKKASIGMPMSRPPFGYKFYNKKLIPAENYQEVTEIFEEFLKTKITLTQLSKKHRFTINGLKKILRNFTYIGKIKFNNQIHEGAHKPIISSTLFNHVQNKLEELKIK